MILRLKGSILICQDIDLSYIDYSEAIHEQKRNWEIANPGSIERPKPIRSEFYCENPYYTSIKQRADDRIKDARIRDGALAVHTTDYKETYEKTPGLAFVNSPAAPSKILLEKSRKEDMLH